MSLLTRNAARRKRQARLMLLGWPSAIDIRADFARRRAARRWTAIAHATAKNADIYTLMR